MDNILPSLTSIGKQKISFTTKDALDPNKLRHHELDPWTLLEGYNEGVLSPAFFAGRTIERGNLTYFKSPFEKPKN